MNKPMNDKLPLYNSRILRVFLEYIQNDYPDIDSDKILKEAMIENYEIEDPAHWFTQKQVDRFYDAMVELTGESDIARKAGRYVTSSNVMGATKQYVLGLMSPVAIYLLMEKLYPLMSRGATVKTKKIGPNTVEMISIPKPGVEEKLFQCENRCGFLEGLSSFFTDQYAKVEHPDCFHRGDSCCRYIITWQQSKLNFWKRIRNYCSPLIILTSGLLFFSLPHTLWAIVTLIAAFLVTLVAYGYEKLENKSLVKTIKEQRESAMDHLLESDIRYNNSLMIQEIGQAATKILDVGMIIKTVMSIMERHLDFDRGMIMLTQKTKLIYKGGYGHTKDQEKLLKSTEFNIDNPDSKGLFVIALKNRKPFLIENLNNIENTFSQKSLGFAKELGGKSLICVPIVFEKKSIGILAVDNSKSKTDLRQSDMNLLMGVASETAISIINARSFEAIRESEAKYRLLSDNISDII